MVESTFVDLLGSFRRLEAVVMLGFAACVAVALTSEWVYGIVRTLWRAARPR